MKRLALTIVAMLAIARTGLGHEQECGTAVTGHELEIVLRQAAAGVYDLGNGPQGILYVPLTFHVVRTNAGTGGLPSARICQALDDLDTAFLGAEIQFYLAGPIDFIDSDAFYFDIDTPTEIDALRSTNPVADTINIYFTPHLANRNGEFCGISSFTWSPVQGIVMHNNCTGVWWNPTTLPHEVGHYSDLLHTHETARGRECVDGSNCETAGDLLCDTPADPGLSTQNVNADCVYVGNETDSCHHDSYAPDTSNLMSASRPLCRNSFTPQQSSRILATLLNLRPELVHFGLPGPYDCNNNGVRDDCDIAGGTSRDSNANGVPDECETLGDLNCDGDIDAFDIEPFLLALFDPDEYVIRFPDCDINNADINSDGAINAFDIEPFLNFLFP